MVDRKFLTDLPKVELHLHLEGSMSVETVKALTEIHNIDPSPVWPDGFPEEFSFTDFPDFGRQYLYGLSLLRSADDLARSIDDLAETLAAQNVRWAEITTTAYSHFVELHGSIAMSPEEYQEGLNAGRLMAEARGVNIGWVIDIPRDLEMPDSTVTIDYLEGALTPDGLVGVGLGGYEVGFPASPYAAHFARATAIGLRSLPHAGETEGAASVRAALDDLGAERVGHGVRCIEDPELVRRIADEGVMLEVCPTSNLLLGVVQSFDEHVFPQLRDAGVRVCLNTDDPGWFATDLVTELAIASEHLGVTNEDHAAMQLDAIEASSAPPEIKWAIAGEVKAFDF